MLRKLAIEYTTVLSNESVRSLNKFSTSIQVMYYSILWQTLTAEMGDGWRIPFQKEFVQVIHLTLELLHFSESVLNKIFHQKKAGRCNKCQCL